jgi:hypothetical protein
MNPIKTSEAIALSECTMQTSLRKQKKKAVQVDLTLMCSVYYVPIYFMYPVFV